MRLAALLPSNSIEHVQTLLPERRTTFATSFEELGEVLSIERPGAVLVDPHSDGDQTDAVVEMISRYPRARFIAYVQRTALSLRAVFRLSKHGLEDVFVHPVRPSDSRFLNTIRKIEADTLALDVLAAAEGKLAQLTPELEEVIFDLFRRPYRYESVSDLAAEARISIRGLYRELERCECASARKLISMAKVIHGFSYLQCSPRAIGEVARKLGYSTQDSFSKHMLQHLGMRPTAITSTITPESALLHLIEAVQKPSQLDRRSSRWLPKRIAQ
jgi:AraC-like DNA-binding protein